MSLAPAPSQPIIRPMSTIDLTAEDRRVIKALAAERSDAQGLRQAGAHLGFVLVTGFVVWLTRGTWLVWPAMFVHGVGLVFLFCALHETVHRTAFATVRLNGAMSCLAGFAVGLSPAWFRAFHLAHHRHTQKPGEDPELDDKHVDTWGAYLWHVSGGKNWVSVARGLVSQAAGRVSDRFVSDRVRPKVVAEARAFLALYALVAAVSLAAGSAAALVYWVLPMVLAQPVLRLYLLAEHGLCPFVGDPFQNTRTTLTTRFVRFIAWNMPYHTEHHAFMAVPFHKLPELHAHFGDRLEHLEEHGYGAFNRRYVSEVVAAQRVA